MLRRHCRGVAIESSASTAAEPTSEVFVLKYCNLESTERVQFWPMELDTWYIVDIWMAGPYAHDLRNASKLSYKASSL